MPTLCSRFQAVRFWDFFGAVEYLDMTSLVSASVMLVRILLWGCFGDMLSNLVCVLIRFIVPLFSTDGSDGEVDALTAAPAVCLGDS